MKYYKYYDEEGYENPVWVYNEFDDEWYCLRAIYEEVGGKSFSTNKVAEGNPYVLPEGSFKNDLDSSVKIPKSAFETQWKKALRPLWAEWESLKEKIAIGQRIPSKILLYYPQGAILNIGEKFNGICDRKKCEEVFGENLIFSKKELSFRVESFDDQNMWIRMKPL